MTNVPKFQMPQDTQEQVAQREANHSGTDLDIPEINTNFMDNMFADPEFVARFDASYETTYLMGIDPEVPRRPSDKDDSIVDPHRT